MNELNAIISNIGFQLSHFLTLKTISKVVRIVIYKGFKKFLIKRIELNKTRQVKLCF